MPRCFVHPFSTKLWSSCMSLELRAGITVKPLPFPLCPILLQVLSTLFAKPFSHCCLFASDCCVVHLRSECFNKPAGLDLEPCICCPFAPCWLIIIAHVVVEAAAVTRVWASQTTQCYTVFRTLHSVTQCYAVWATSIRCRKDRKCASRTCSCFILSVLAKGIHAFC